MKQPRSLLVAALGTAVLVGALGLPRYSNAQAPAGSVLPSGGNALAANALPPADDAQAIAALVAEISTQQAAIVENQKKIDAKLAMVTENLRIARIYVSRGGGATNK